MKAASLVADFYLHDLWLQRPSGQLLLLAVVANLGSLALLAAVWLPKLRNRGR
jgi:hypothetical protein